jgi:hypothetical protein
MVMGDEVDGGVHLITQDFFAIRDMDVHVLLNASFTPGAWGFN